MTTTWVLVASRANARFFEHRGPNKGLAVVSEITHEKGRLKDSEINADRPGRAFDRLGAGRHAIEPNQSPHDRISEDFARDLARRALEGRNANRFDQLILVAEAGFLGMLRDCIDAATKKRVIGSVSKDLAAAGPEDIGRALSKLLAV
jgi:protein required for attachment to host cells